MGANDDGKLKTYKILIYVFVNPKKVRNLWVEIRVTHDASNQNNQMQDIESFKTNPNSSKLDHRKLR